MSLPPLPPQEMPSKLSDPIDWVDRYGDALLRFASDCVASREPAEDFVLETLLPAFRHRTQFAGKSAFGTWLVANRFDPSHFANTCSGRSLTLPSSPRPAHSAPTSESTKPEKTGLEPVRSLDSRGQIEVRHWALTSDSGTRGYRPD